MNINRRTFFGAVAALVGAGQVKPKPKGKWSHSRAIVGFQKDGVPIVYDSWGAWSKDNQDYGVKIWSSGVRIHR